MQNPSVIQINLDKVLVTLFCCYALSMPFELILEYWFSIDTIFKPFRVFSIIIIGVFGIKVFTQGFHLDKRDRSDWFLYGVFIYGLLISCFRIIGGVFNMGLFLNDTFQFGLHVITFFIFKSTPISKKEAFKIFNWFLVGIFLNSIYITYKFIGNMSWGRQSGFTDNPNYAAFGLVAALTFLLLKTGFTKKTKFQLLNIAGICYLFYTFGIQGSRTGFVMILITSMLVFFFSSWRRKLAIIAISSFILLLLIPQQLDVGQSNSVLVRRFNTKQNSGEEDVRFPVWRGVFRVLEDRGYAGMGIGQFKANFPKYFSQESNKLILEMTNYGYYLSPHNDYLAILVDYGLPSLLFYLTFLGANTWKLFRRVNYPKEDQEEELLMQFNFIFFLCIIIFGMSAENFQHQLYWFLLMFTTKNYYE